MSLNNTINDSDVVYGSSPITLGGAASIPSQVYETTDFNLTPEIERFVRKSSKGIPNGRVTILGERTGTATLHYPSSTVVAPVFGDPFTTTQNAIAYSCTITKVGLTRTFGAEAMVPISFDVNIGAVVLSVAT